MPSWNEILEELRVAGSTHDLVRRQYLDKLHEVTGRNVIVYYSGWLQKSLLVQQVGPIAFTIDDNDKSAFMAAAYELDHDLGLDLILHTPGGDLAATESIVMYLRELFGTDIRVIVPQLAMSAGTMIALSSKQILMGAHSNLGPIDPMVAGMAAHGILEEYLFAQQEVQSKPATVPLWQMIFNQYSPTLIGECEKAIDWTEELVKEWLTTCMFDEDEDAEEKSAQVFQELGDHALTKSHNRHISREAIEQLELNVMRIEENQELQEAIMGVHHSCTLTLEQTTAFKLTENHNGIAYIRRIHAGRRNN